VAGLISGPLDIHSSQIQVFGEWVNVFEDVDTLLDTAADCLCFVTEFFEVISQSGPHVYHSALLLAPQSSLVRKLYDQQIRCPAARVVTGIPASWDSCTAILGTTTEVRHAVWSPCGQFVAACFANGVGIRDSTTLGKVSDLRPPSGLTKVTPESLAFSPNGRLLACTFHPVRESNLSVSLPHIPSHTYLCAQIEYIHIPLCHRLGHPDRYCRPDYSHLGPRRDCILWKPNHTHSYRRIRLLHIPWNQRRTGAQWRTLTITQSSAGWAMGPRGVSTVRHKFQSRWGTRNQYPGAPSNLRLPASCGRILLRATSRRDIFLLSSLLPRILCLRVRSRHTWCSALEGPIPDQDGPSTLHATRTFLSQWTLLCVWDVTRGDLYLGEHACRLYALEQP
jgi:hypothetical protein